MKTHTLSNLFLIIFFSGLVFLSTNQNKTQLYQCYVGIDNLQQRSSSGSPGGYTGSIGDGDDCTSCHDGGSFSLAASITTNIPITGYVSGATYLIEVNATSDNTEAGRGFELTVENSAGTSIGDYDFTGATGSPIALPSDGSVTHSDENSFSWTFNWVAPVTDEGIITFYTSVLAVNNAQGTNGDQNSLASESYNRNTLGLLDTELVNFSFSPNPALDVVNIQLPHHIVDANFHFFNLNGQLLKSANINHQNQSVDVSFLTKGLYLIRMSYQGKTSIGKLLKQ